MTPLCRNNNAQSNPRTAPSGAARLRVQTSVRYSVYLRKPRFIGCVTGTRPGPRRRCATRSLRGPLEVRGERSTDRSPRRRRRAAQPPGRREQTRSHGRPVLRHHPEDHLPLFPVACWAGAWQGVGKGQHSTCPPPSLRVPRRPRNRTGRPGQESSEMDGDAAGCPPSKPLVGDSNPSGHANTECVNAAPTRRPS